VGCPCELPHLDGQVGLTGAAARDAMMSRLPYHQSLGWHPQRLLPLRRAASGAVLRIATAWAPHQRMLAACDGGAGRNV
jgi:hypothetical protein